MKFPEGMDQAELAKLFAQFLVTQMGAGPKPTFRDCWARYAAWGTSRTAGGRTRIKSWQSSQASVEKYLLEYFGDLPYDQVTLGKADEFRVWRGAIRNVLTKKLPAPATLNKTLRCAAACLGYCKKKAFITSNPLEGLRDEAAPNNRDFAIPQADLLRLVEQARPWLRWFLFLLWETGMRSSELRTLEWSDINMEHGKIKLPGERCKGGYDRDIALTELARWILSHIPADGVNPHVFANQHGPSGPISESTLKRAWKIARGKAGVKGPKGQEIWLHTLRHTWATDAITSGIDLKTVMSQGGWKSPVVADKYFNVDDRHRSAAAAKLDERSISILKALQQPARAAKRVAPPLHVVPKKEKGTKEE